MAKRKGNEGNGEGTGSGSIGGQQAQKPSQVFLRNLPLSMLEPDIETMLGDCGPIKRIDLIKTMDRETGAKLSRGFGFVTFALEADAAKACETIHGKRVMGRDLSCEIALKKGAKREGMGRAEKQVGQGQREGAGPMGAVSPADEAAAVSTYGGCATAGANKPSSLPPSTATAAKPASVKVPTDEDDDGSGGRDKQPKATVAVTVGSVVKGPEKSALRAKAAAGVAGDHEAGACLNKKQARKAERKQMKKDRKEKAKEKAREKKVTLAREAAATDAAIMKADAKPTNPTDDAMSIEGVEGAKEGEIGENDRLDPKAAKLQRDARTLLVFGVADDLTAKQLQKRVKKYATIKALTLEDNDGRFFPGGRVARVECEGKESTRKIIAGLDGHTVHGKTLRARRLMEIVPGHDVRQQKQQRLIVRNLNFHAKEDDLATAFSEFGPLSEVHIPTVRVTSQRRIRGTDGEETVTENRSRGFGFVQFLCPKDAARVVKDNGVLEICGRDAAVDYSITKEKYTALKQGHDDTFPTTPAGGEGGGDGDEKEGTLESDGEEEDERNATDGASSPDSDDGDDDDEDDDDSDKQEEGGPDAAAGIGRNTVATAAKRASDVQQGCTVFVRNVAFDCGEKEVRERFEEFGTVRLALLVKDQATGMPRGTAFVKFSNKVEADRCLAAAIGATDPANARDSGGSCVYLGSRALHVTRAVDREEAGRLAVGAQKRVGHKDKRNLYLADEGLVVQDSGAAEGAAKSDLEKRVQARRDKKTKLKNPIFFVSPVRLSVRNLARGVTDAKLKAMALAAARSGIEAGRSNPQDVRRYLEAQGEEFAAITPRRLQIPPVRSGAVLKSKIIRDMDKKPNPNDPSELHLSKGYGFVEFAHHGHALAALRQLNNNPAYSSYARSEGVAKGETSRLIVEFSVENHAKLKLQQGRQEAFEQRKRELKGLGLGQDGRPARHSEDKEKKSRGKIQRERKKRPAPTSAEDLAKENNNDDEQSGKYRETSDAAAASPPKPSPKKKRKKSNKNTEPTELTQVDGAKGVKRGRVDGDDRGGGGEGSALNSGDAEIDTLVMQLGTEGEDRSKRKSKKKASKYEHVDAEEHAYRKLEREYTNKTNKAAAGGGKGAAEGAKGGLGEVAAAAGSKKGRQGRWFD